jgi:hypothetical protein
MIEHVPMRLNHDARPQLPSPLAFGEAHVAYAMTPLTREERATRAKIGRRTRTGRLSGASGNRTEARLL